MKWIHCQNTVVEFIIKNPIHVQITTQEAKNNFDIWHIKLNIRTEPDCHQKELFLSNQLLLVMFLFKVKSRNFLTIHQNHFQIETFHFNFMFLLKLLSVTVTCNDLGWNRKFDYWNVIFWNKLTRFCK